MAGIIAVHTGAGNKIDETKYQQLIKEACIRATDILRNGGSAMDACEAAIIQLENSGNTNAGFGSNLCWDGHVQCDASIMNGANLQFGACTNVSTVKNPIQLARRICDGQGQMLSMDRIPPMIMAGTGAEHYAEEIGCTTIDPNAMISSKAEFLYKHYKPKVLNSAAEKAEKAGSEVGAPPPPTNGGVMSAETALDTVGAVCVDGAGNSAAGCSSGGLLLKIPGRVGQGATYGAGCWATDTAELTIASCTTGNGEYLMKTMLAKEICMDLLESECAVSSMHKTFKCKFLESPFVPVTQELYGGALTLVYYPRSNNGEVLWCHTTKAFCVGYMTTTQKTPKFVYSHLPNYSTPGKSTIVNGSSFHLRI